MPSRRARSGPANVVFDDQSSGRDPPSSSVAAQIVDNLTITTKRRTPRNETALWELTSEILKSDQQDDASSTTIEQSIDINHSLIYVIFRAGLETLNSNNPFNSQNHDHTQGIQSLAVIDLTIRRCPDVLFYIPQGHDVRSRPSGPLFLWLLPQLMNLLTDDTNNEIREMAEKTVKTALSTQRQPMASKFRLHSICKYILGCIKDLLLFLEAPPDLSGTKSRESVSTLFKVPTLETILEVYPQERQQNWLATESHVSLQDTSRIPTIILHLIPMVFPQEPHKTQNIIKRAPPDLAWLLETLTRLFLILELEKSPTSTHHFAGNRLALFLTILTGSVSYAVHRRSESVLVSQSIMLLGRSLRKLLSVSFLDLKPSLEDVIRRSLSDLCAICTESSTCLEAFYRHLKPILQETVDRADFNERCGESLKHAVMQALRLAESDTRDITRPRKRARLSDTSSPSADVVEETRLVNHIRSLLGIASSTSLHNLNQIELKCYENLSENNQCSLLMTFGRLPCIVSQRHSVQNGSGSQNSIGQCWLCDSEKPIKPPSGVMRDVDCDYLLITVKALLDLPQLHKATRLRIILMRSLRRLLSHTNNPNHLDLKNSTFGQWCLRALHSSNRDLRIAAGRTLMVFLEDRVSRDVLHHNRSIALNHLRTLSENSDIGRQETCVLAWSQISCVCGEGEKNVILLKMVEYLGHPNPLISGLAYDELLQMSNHSSFAAMRLFNSYWETIAVTVVKDLNTRPQIAQQMCDILNVKISDFLEITQVYTIPFLILTRKRDVLQRIADACVPDQSIFGLCTKKVNMAAIVSHLLLQPSTDVERMVMTLLCEASSEFRKCDLGELVNADPISIACNLLEVAGEEEETKKVRARQAIFLLAEATQGRLRASKSLTREVDKTAAFFETFVLGIMTLLSKSFNDTESPQPTSGKRKCLGAIKEMILLARGHIRNGLPQISASLRSAIEIEEFCNEAFDAWISLILTLQEEDIESLVDPTFAIVAQYWESFNPTTQERAYQMVSQLIKSHKGLILDMVNTIPSLSSISLMVKFENELGNLRAQMDTRHQYQAFAQRCQNENATVVTRALVELEAYLCSHQGFLHAAAISEQPDLIVGQLTRSILNACVRFSEANSAIASLCAKCLGLIGCLDPTRVEATREVKDRLVLSNFVEADETIDFILFLIQEVLVKTFLSATDTKAQGLLAFAIQELLKYCNLDTSLASRSCDEQASESYRKWVALPESVRNILTPFLKSSYTLVLGPEPPECIYPLYNSSQTYSTWLRTFIYDLLRNGCGDNASVIFAICKRLVRKEQDISIANFLLPFAALNVIVGGTEDQKLGIRNELLIVLSQPLPENRPVVRETLVLCSQSVFQVLDYLSKWMQSKKKDLASSRAAAHPAAREPFDIDEESILAQIASIENVLFSIPAEVISRRAVECKSYARALFHWEQYIRKRKETNDEEGPGLEPLYERLQDIYTQIDEPDGIEGISAHLQVLNIDQQVLEHRKAGRWTAVQSWYELLLTERPYDLDVQLSLLTSLKESGQHDVLLTQSESFEPSQASILQSRPFAVEASWLTGKWEKLVDCLSRATEDLNGDFNVGIGFALAALYQKDYDRFTEIINKLRSNTARSLSPTIASSLQSCHDALLRFHILTEVELISGINSQDLSNKTTLLTSLSQRLEFLGAFPSDKQFVLGLRRAAIQLSRLTFSPLDLSTAWLTSAKLARKGRFTHQAFNAVLHASRIGDNSATIEHARLLWGEGSHRKAIQTLEGAIAANAFRSYDYVSADESTTTNDNHRQQQQQNLLTARAHLLLAKWVDKAGQTQSDLITKRYKKAVEFHNRWEKGHYYLGKHYNKLLESEKGRPPAKQAQTFITGETAKLVIENYLRSLAFGTKYMFQTLPRILTLWLELGVDVDKPPDPRYGNEDSFRSHIIAQRRRLFGAVNSQVKKYIDRLPAFVYYTAFAQIVARICHTNSTIYASLADIIAKIVTTHPQQALWTLLAMVKSSATDRSSRGNFCMKKIIEHTKKMKTETAVTEMKTLMTQGQKLSEQLLNVCEGIVEKGTTRVSITRKFAFFHKVAPCRLVIPLESTLTASLPVVTDNINMKTHRAFSKDTVTISAFVDEALVLTSLQQPRKISIRGSDGRVYSLLCKPKDDLRKDQRLLEFNAMINRFLKRDADSRKRQLYIKTYAVTPLNEECGLIEWVDNLKTLREILLVIYKQKNVQVHYKDIEALLNEACSDISKLPLFTHKVLPYFPPVFHEWFVEMFPDPSAWFAARLKYTRSCAVMSMVGYVLGLGDRHGENILFEEGNGGTFHVDFNCLFDQGANLAKPELVPFRLTHNMVDAFGAYGYEGPFRKSSELTLGILRQNEDTLMTILETFLYDPTTDFIGKKKKNSAVPDTPEGVLESVRNKVRGLFPMESVPLSVEGHVQELIQQATDPMRLASMYIGWCSFF